MLMYDKDFVDQYLLGSAAACAEVATKSGALEKFAALGGAKFLEEAANGIAESGNATEAEPVVHARWVPAEIDGRASYICDRCGSEMPTDAAFAEITERENRFCYWCGAKMDGGVGDV